MVDAASAVSLENNCHRVDTLASIILSRLLPNIQNDQYATKEDITRPYWWKSVVRFGKIQILQRPWGCKVHHQ